jgi:hypothetical protein
VLAHQSGLYHIRQMVDRATRMLDSEAEVPEGAAAIPQAPPLRKSA